MHDAHVHRLISPLSRAVFSVKRAFAPSTPPIGRAPHDADAPVRKFPWLSVRNVPELFGPEELKTATRVYLKQRNWLKGLSYSMDCISYFHARPWGSVTTFLSLRGYGRLNENQGRSANSVIWRTRDVSELSICTPGETIDDNEYWNHIRKLDYGICRGSMCLRFFLS